MNHVNLPGEREIEPWVCPSPGRGDRVILMIAFWVVLAAFNTRKLFSISLEVHHSGAAASFGLLIFLTENYQQILHTTFEILGEGFGLRLRVSFDFFFVQFWKDVRIYTWSCIREARGQKIHSPAPCVIAEQFYDAKHGWLVKVSAKLLQMYLIPGFLLICWPMEMPLRCLFHLIRHSATHSPPRELF